MDTIGGYRLVRKLGSGARADVFLGHAGHATEAADQRTAAIKIYRPSVPWSSIDVELEALARASFPHLIRLDDLAMTQNGRPVAVLARLGSTNLSNLLTNRGELTPGEAVTIVAPLAQAVSELHRVGVAHGRVVLRSVLFDPAGAPVLAAFGHAILIGPMPESAATASMSPAQLTESRGALSDLADLVNLARAVIELIPENPARTRILDWLLETSPAEQPANFPRELSDRCFDLAGAEPVRFDVGSAARNGHPAERRQGAPLGQSRARHGMTETSTTKRHSTSVASLHLPEWLERAGLAGWMSQAELVGAAVRHHLASVRKPVWIAAAVPAALLATTLMVVQSGILAPPDERRASAAQLPPSAVPNAASKPSEVPGSGDALTAGEAADAAAVAGDDPVEAAIVLLTRRSQCLQDHSILCLADVHQRESAAEEADSYLVRQMQEGTPLDGAVRFDEAAPLLVQRMGNSALLSLGDASAPGSSTPGSSTPGDSTPNSNPASLLLVKGEAGWRIRDLIPR